tara:strand:- start:1313 stop:2503 length:1191 start_codon:yes stop_codon:yes gene_type:complete
MYFNNVLGNELVKKLLLAEFHSNRVPHAQLFFGEDASQQLPMALAFSSFIFCKKRSSSDACGQCSSCVKMSKLIHPDLHFFYPTIKIQKGEEKKSESKKYFPKLQETLLENPAVNINKWETNLHSTKKASIRSADLVKMCDIANLKSYEGEYKIFIIWGADKIIQKSSSILLKTLEEPRAKTVFILIANNPNLILPTITSRLQVKRFEKINKDILTEYFEKKFPHIEKNKITSEINNYKNNYYDILDQLKENNNDDSVISEFINWIRLCFLCVNQKSKCMNPKTNEIESVMIQLISWCNMMADCDKNFQNQLINKAIEVIREAFLLNYDLQTLICKKTKHPNFSIHLFSKYIQHNNIAEILSLLSNANYCLDRYANSKILFLDLSFNLGKLLNKNK